MGRVDQGSKRGVAGQYSGGVVKKERGNGR